MPTGLPTRYRLGRVVGRGGTATVWLARDTRTGRDVVAKVLGPGAVPVERFEAEVRALGRLTGVDGVVEVRAVGCTVDGRPWLVEDLVVGPTLADQLRRAPWPGAQVRDLVHQLAATLAAAHAAGVVHGDVAPANVLCRPDGTYLLCDFGVAALGEGVGGPAPCTPSFAAPERLAGAPPSRAADVFGLGVLAWFAATGSLPPDVPCPGPLDVLGRRRSLLLVRALDPDPARRPSAAAVARRSR